MYHICPIYAHICPYMPICALATTLPEGTHPNCSDNTCNTKQRATQLPRHDSGAAGPSAPDGESRVPQRRRASAKCPTPVTYPPPRLSAACRRSSRSRDGDSNRGYTRSGLSCPATFSCVIKFRQRGLVAAFAILATK